MKKIILGLFLILGVISFAIPKNLDANKLKKAGYEITSEEENAIIFGKSTQTAGITVALFNGASSPKNINISLRETAPKSQKFLSSSENKRAYISKYKDNEYNGFTYSFVAKNSKSKDTVVSVLYATDNELSNTELNNAVDKVLNEVESYLK